MQLRLELLHVAAAWTKRFPTAPLMAIFCNMQGIKYTPTYAFFKRGLKVAQLEYGTSKVNACPIAQIHRPIEDTLAACRSINLWHMRLNS